LCCVVSSGIGKVLVEATHQRAEQETEVSCLEIDTRNGRSYAKETLASDPMLTEEIERAIHSTLVEQASDDGRG
jgi:hypothetical protein